MEVATLNNVRVYTVAGGSKSRSLPDWLVKKRRKVLKADMEWRHRIELLQDFEFPEASLKVKTTRDGNFAIATGVYKPQMRVFEYSEMSMKFDRHTDSENVNFLILSDDWTKTVHLQCDRSIEFHSQGGIHYRSRIPKFGRDIAYHYPSCDLLIAAAGSEVYRLNLDQGRYLNSLATDSPNGVNVATINPAHQLYAFGTGAGTVEFWDPRTRERVNTLFPSPPGIGGSMEVTAASYRDDGLSLAVGTSTGHTLLYDLRTNRPWVVKDQGYGNPIKSIHWHDGGSSFEGAGKVMSSDSKILKIWDRNDGKHFTSIEPTTDINDVCPVKDSGLIYVANEGIQIQTYYIPELGPAPRWCAFLDNLTEELEERPQENVYDDFKFITRKELANLGLDHLVGSNLLRPYMHGYFVDLRLYEKARLIANPFAYEEHKAQQAKAKVEAQRESRIRVTSKLPKVNRALASRLLDEAETGSTDKKSKKKKADASVPNAMQDQRFAELFANTDFEVDEESTEFQLLHPTKSARAPRPRFEEDDHREPANAEESEREGKGSDEETSEGESSEEEFHQRKPVQKSPASTGIRSGAAERRRPPRMYTGGARVGAKQSMRSLGERVATETGARSNTGRRVASGAMEMSFQIRGGGRGGARGGARGRGRGGSGSAGRGGGGGSGGGGGGDRPNRRKAMKG